MYKIENIKEADTLPPYLGESEHISQYILKNSNPVKGKEERSFKLFHRTADTSVTVFNINETEVWCKKEEANFILPILSKVKDGKICYWYVAGSSTPLFSNSQRASSMYGYEVHVMYSEQ